MTEATQLHKNTVAMNEALILSSLRQQELVGLTDELNAKLRREITERKVAEATLHESEERYRALFEMGPVAIYSCHASGVIQHFNRRAAELWGREPVLGDKNERFCGSFKMFRPDGSYMPHDQCPMSDVLSGKIPEARDVEVHVERPDGTRITAVVNIRPLKNQRGEITGAINSFFDVTERKQAEEALRETQTRLRFTLEAAQLGDWDLNLIDDTAQRSSRHDKAFGYDEPVQDWGFEKFIAHVHPEDRPEVERLFRAAVTDRTDWHFECRVVWPDGDVHWIAADGRPYRTQNGEPTHMLGIVSNIDERKLHEEQQELLLREMDHRVKNLFAIVGGMVALSARSATTPKELAQTVQGRLGALASAHQLIRPRHSVADATKRETTLGELVRKVLSPYIDPADTGESARTEIDGPEIAVGAEAATNVALVVHELATNAAKYGALSVPGGRVRISWAVAEGRLALSWEEKGGPVIAAPPMREGFGSELARRSVNGGLRGDLTFHWNPDGLVVLVSAETEHLAL